MSEIQRSKELSENIEHVRQRIRQACQRCGRSVDEVTLIAVSKTKPVSDVYGAIEAGMFHFGENKVQELTMKMDTLEQTPPILPPESGSEKIHWHMIGHLQKNKVKYIVGRVDLIHSVDSVELAKKIQDEAAKKDVVVNILVEVNVAGEESKFGTTKDEALSMVETIAKFPNIRIQGLMTIAPFVENPEDNRIYFRNLKKLAVDIKSKNIDNVTMSILSMGMTGDYEVAIEEGATMVRVGTGIFGERNYLS